MTLLCLIACDSLKEARKIAKSLLEKRLVACANIFPKIESHYRWKGKLEKASESLLILKTRKGMQKRVLKEISELHGYELPVIEFVEAEALKEVEKWIERETN